MDSKNAAKLNVTLSMFIYGTIGIFVRHIPLPSAVTAMARGLIGAPFLLLVLALKKQRPDGAAIKGNLPLLLLLGLTLGSNWILLFEAYRYTTVATATLCYYFAPIIIVAASPFVLKEISNFFANYKVLQNVTVTVGEYLPKKDALRIIEECRAKYNP